MFEDVDRQRPQTEASAAIGQISEWPSHRRPNLCKSRPGSTRSQAGGIEFGDVRFELGERLFRVIEGSHHDDHELAAGSIG